MVLGRDPPLFLYAVIIAVGIAGGVTSGTIALKFPEPETDSENKGTSFWRSHKSRAAALLSMHLRVERSVIEYSDIFYIV
jgi:hypothetical protein